MQVIKPVTITESNMTSTIAEPDVSVGEAEWIQNRPNYFEVDYGVRGLTVVGDTIYAVVYDGAYKVYSYDKDGNFITDFSVNPGSFGIANDGTYLYVAYSSSTTTAEIYIYEQNGTYVNNYTLTFTQAATQNAYALCYYSGTLYVHSRTTGTHSTVSLFNSSDGSYIEEFDISEIGYDIYDITVNGGAFYINSSGNTVYSADVLFTSFTFQSNITLNNALTYRLYFDGDVYWTACTRMSAYYIGWISDDWLGYGIYLTGEQAIKASTHKLYQASTNTTDDPEIGVLKTPPTWVEVSSTNQFRMFDYSKSAKSTGTSPEVIEITPAVKVSAVGFFNLIGVRYINITITDPTLGEVYNVDYDLLDITGVLNMWQYFYYDLLYVDYLVIDDIPVYKFATIAITFTAESAGSDISIGEVVTGFGKTIGQLVSGTSTDRKSYSTVEYDDFGNETIVKRPSATFTTFQVSLPSSDIKYVESMLANIIDEPTLFVGDDVAGEKLSDFGYYERSALVRKNPSVSEITLKVRGVI